MDNKLNIGNWLMLSSKTDYAKKILAKKGKAWKILDSYLIEDREAVVVTCEIEEPNAFRGLPPIKKASESTADRLTIFLDDDNFDWLKINRSD